MYCTECGKQIQDGSAYCPYCGKNYSAGQSVRKSPIRGGGRLLYKVRTSEDRYWFYIVVGIGCIIIGIVILAIVSHGVADMDARFVRENKEVLDTLNQLARIVFILLLVEGVFYIWLAWGAKKRYFLLYENGVRGKGIVTIYSMLILGNRDFQYTFDEIDAISYIKWLGNASILVVKGNQKYAIEVKRHDMENVRSIIERINNRA